MLKTKVQLGTMLYTEVKKKKKKIETKAKSKTGQWQKNVLV